MGRIQYSRPFVLARPKADYSSSHVMEDTDNRLTLKDNQANTGCQDSVIWETMGIIEEKVNIGVWIEEEAVMLIFHMWSIAMGKIYSM